MSQKLLAFARSFTDDQISAVDFADPYQMLWKAEGENGDSLKDNFQDSEKCSTIFCLADQFNPDDDRDKDEFDADELKARVRAVLDEE
ncbi:colicin immunity domain-containing protein [Rahnella victoriana]|uniref:Colicin n=1 Tax=Rahnella victoriana TaxID=1510570 RepID=A0ABS0DSL7_9GAMM|nr:colicin immunity domain-containing protein [Rahnella victoriana]MBF7956864.1 colicin [Rahnella victoriana]UHM89156.1 colicin immunity domain-containing protein [Rahnella victoriana]